MDTAEAANRRPEPAKVKRKTRRGGQGPPANKPHIHAMQSTLAWQRGKNRAGLNLTRDERTSRPHLQTYMPTCSSEVITNRRNTGKCREAFKRSTRIEAKLPAQKSKFTNSQNSNHKESCLQRDGKKQGGESYLNTGCLVGAAALLRGICHRLSSVQVCRNQG